MRRLLWVPVLLVMTQPSWAQEPAAHAAPSTPAAQASTIDATKLGVSLSRIRRELRETDSERRADSPLRLSFQVQVYGAAPKIDVLSGFDLLNGDAPNAAPTHQQMIDFWTPQAFKSPAWPIGALAIWAGKQVAKKTEKELCEQALAQYRELLMQGVNVSAPRCASQ